MTQVAALAGSIVGLAIDPFLWGIAALTAFMGSAPWPRRLLMAFILYSAAAGAAYALAGWRFGPFNWTSFIASLAIGCVWFAIFVGIRTLISRRRAAG
jgi:hypothetical protein